MKKWNFRLFGRTVVEVDENLDGCTQNANEAKEVAFYTETLSAWYSTNMECDKAKLTISSGAIGVLLSIFTALSSEKLCCSAIFSMIFALCFFLITIIITAVIFKKNATLLESVINNQEHKSIGSLDVISWVLFCLGLFFSIVFIAIVAVNKISL